MNINLREWYPDVAAQFDAEHVARQEVTRLRAQRRKMQRAARMLALRPYKWKKIWHSEWRWRIQRKSWNGKPLAHVTWRDSCPHCYRVAHDGECRP